MLFFFLLLLLFSYCDREQLYLIGFDSKRSLGKRRLNGLEVGIRDLIAIVSYLPIFNLPFLITLFSYRSEWKCLHL